MYEINSGILAWVSDNFLLPQDITFQIWKCNSALSQVGVFLPGSGIFILEVSFI